MDWYDSVFEVIDLRSFSNLWYWIGLAVLWSSVSHWVLGVPYDTIMRARRGKPETAMEDLHDNVRVCVTRILLIAETSGILMALFGSAGVTALWFLAFVYKIEFAQAVFLLLFPMVILSVMSLRTARIIKQQDLRGDALIKRMLWHRFITQIIGVFSIFVTAMYGMWVNLWVGPFGGF
ncbi:component of SufBCD complex [Rhodobacteraceae bacterium]|nr:component of SufBCD complex [Paracoccaceae bacterium]